jgi:hypothetical protein
MHSAIQSGTSMAHSAISAHSTTPSRRLYAILRFKKQNTKRLIKTAISSAEKKTNPTTPARLSTCRHEDNSPNKQLAKDCASAKDLQETWGEGTFWCNAHFPQSILKLCRAGLEAKPYTFKREDGLRELGSRLTPASDEKTLASL